MASESKELFRRYGWVQNFLVSDQMQCCKGVAILIRRGAGIELKFFSTDSTNRWVLAGMTWADFEFICVGFYGPNEDDPQDIVDLELRLVEATAPLILGGDYNILLDPILDRSTRRDSAPVPKTRRALKNIMQDLGLVDVWRHERTVERLYLP